jgi:hypothetical protein
MTIHNADAEGSFEDEPVFTHQACGFPIEEDEDGRWQHVSPADGVFCDLLFSGGSMLDNLMDEDDTGDPRA